MNGNHSVPELSDDVITAARLKSMLGIVTGLLLFPQGYILYGVGFELLGAVASILSSVIFVVSWGRDSPTVRKVVELIPGWEYDFPPLDTLYDEDR